MARSRERNQLTRLAGILGIGVAVLALGFTWADAASASQGPGVAAGSASSFTQAMMAILVYGASALVVGSGLIGALRPQ
jgi:hypothetical protein